MTAQSGSGLGARLASARLRAGLTVIQAAERLHVDPRVIEALEAERFEEFGAAVYVRGHIRHYAELVREEPAELQALYAGSAHAARTPDLRQVPQGHSPVEDSRALLVPAVVVVSAVAIIGIVWWVAGTLRAARTQHTGAAPALSAPQAAVTAAQSAAAATQGALGAAPPPGTVTAAVRGVPIVAAQSALGTAAPDAAVPAQSPPSAAFAPSRGELTSIRTQAPAAGEEAALSMRFARDSWTEVYDARGRRLFYDVGSADSTRTVSGTPPLRIVLGNPAGVSLQLDGRTVPMPAGVEPNVRIEFEITRSGRAVSHLAAASEAGARAP